MRAWYPIIMLKQGFYPSLYMVFIPETLRNSFKSTKLSINRSILLVWHVCFLEHPLYAQMLKINARDYTDRECLSAWLGKPNYPVCGWGIWFAVIIQGPPYLQVVPFS